MGASDPVGKQNPSNHSTVVVSRVVGSKHALALSSVMTATRVGAVSRCPRVQFSVRSADARLSTGRDAINSGPLAHISVIVSIKYTDD